MALRRQRQKLIVYSDCRDFEGEFEACKHFRAMILISWGGSALRLYSMASRLSFPRRLPVTPVSAVAYVTRHNSDQAAKPLFGFFPAFGHLPNSQGKH